MNELRSTRHLWQMDCACLTTILTHCLNEQERRAFAEPHICDCCEEKLDNPAWVLQALHEACHQASPPARAIEALLEHRHLDVLEHVEETGALALARELAAHTPRDHQRAGMIFALLRNPDRQKCRLGKQMVHALLLAQVEPAGDRPPTATDRVAELEQQVAEQQATIDRMLAYIHDTRGEIVSAG